MEISPSALALIIAVIVNTSMITWKLGTIKNALEIKVVELDKDLSNRMTKLEAKIEALTNIFSHRHRLDDNSEES